MTIDTVQEALGETLDPLPAEETTRTLLEFLELAGGFQWPILGVFVLGLTALSLTLARLYLDGRSARELRRASIRTADFDTIRQLARHEGESLYHRLMAGVVERARIRLGPDSMLESVRGQLAAAEKGHDRIHRLVRYCSDAAGGLGLTGTLVGMYASFSAAGSDPQSVYAGISLALVSTLLGIAASLLLGAADTGVKQASGRYIEACREWGEALCLRLAKVTARTAPAKNRKRA